MLTDASLAAPILVIAPHLVYPTRDGADIAIDRRWGAMSKFVSSVDIVAANAVVSYREGKIANSRPFSNKSRPKWNAAVRTFFFRSVYTREKFLTKSYVSATKTYLSDDRYQAVIFSYLASAPLAKGYARANTKRYVLSHNDDVAIYRNMRRTSGNPVQKLVALISEQWVRRFGRAHVNDFRFIHVTEEDADGWRAAIGPHKYCLGKVGCDLPKRVEEERPPMSVRPLRLLFVGSLGVKMNLDAVKYLGDKFLPAMMKDVGPVEVRIVGSNPNQEIKKVCLQNEYSLFANVSEEELAEHFGWADFSVLPFPYSTGTKLKLLDSIARGVPILATACIGTLPGAGGDVGCLASDDPGEWVNHICRWRKDDISDDVREKLVSVAQGWSWESMARHFFETELKQ